MEDDIEDDIENSKEVVETETQTTQTNEINYLMETYIISKLNRYETTKLKQKVNRLIVLCTIAFITILYYLVVIFIKVK